MEQQTLQEQNDITLHTSSLRTNSADNLANSTGSENNYFTSGQLTFIDFFAGIGGFHSGLELAGHRCVGYVEWDKHARKSYEAIYDTKGLYTGNDITEVRGTDLPNADVWCFGSPCQNISIAVNKRGLKGSASSMFFEVIRCLEERTQHGQSTPTYLFMENVKNLLSVNGGWDFAKVLIEMDKAGYDVEWQVINSAWTIPQNRERVFIVGHKRGIDSNQVFPITTDEIQKSRRHNSLKDILEADVDNKYLLKDKLVDKLNEHNLQVALSSYVNSGESTGKITPIYNGRQYGLFGDTHTILSPNGICTTLNTMSGGNREPKVGYKQNGEWVLRKLTPRECWRLQGFTDRQFDEAKNAGVSDSQLYKQAGNAVTVPVIYNIAKHFQINK